MIGHDSWGGGRAPPWVWGSLSPPPPPPHVVNHVTNPTCCEPTYCERLFSPDTTLRAPFYLLSFFLSSPNLQPNIVSLREAFRRKGKLYLVFE